MGQIVTTTAASHDAKVPLKPPAMADIGLIAMVPEVWGNPWQSRHFILTRLAKYFHIVWFNPVREWRQFFGEPVPGMVGGFVGGSRGPGLHVYNAGPLLPRLYRPAPIARLFNKLRYRHAEQILRDKGCNKIVLYNWRPQFIAAHEIVNHDVDCYHIDDEYSFSISEQPTDERERRLIESVDQVFIHSPALMEKKGHINSNTMMVPNGVDYSAYAEPKPAPAEMKDIPHPRLGYIGYLKTQLDFEKQLALAGQHPDWSFVYVGPKGQVGQDGYLVEEFLQQPNVHYLGFKPGDQLPAYAQHMDVLLMVYKVNDYTKYIYPLKVHEFLATGNPVVASPIRSLQQFEDVIALADSVEDWTRAVTAALKDDARSDAVVRRRRDIARQHDWDLLVDKIARTICRHLGSDISKRFESINESGPQASVAGT